MKPEPWTMPEWMEPFRDHIHNRCGGCTVEDLVRDQHTTLATNSVRAAFCITCKSLVSLLTQLHDEGLLLAPTPTDRKGDPHDAPSSARTK